VSVSEDRGTHAPVATAMNSGAKIWLGDLKAK